MNKTSELTHILSQSFQWNKARLTCFSSMILALLACRTVCLQQMAVVIKGKKFYLAEKLFNRVNPKQQQAFNMDVEVFGQKVYLVGSRSKSRELMIVATNQSPKNAIAIYLRRWEIENLFQCLKSRRFHFEQTHITVGDRLEKLIALLAIGFCWAHKVGEWRHLKKPIPFNHYRESRRPQYSYFRYGLD